MIQLNKKNIIIAGVVGVVILGGIYFYLSGKSSQPAVSLQEEKVFEEVISIAGKVVSVDFENGAFMFSSPNEETIQVVIGPDTRILGIMNSSANLFGQKKFVSFSTLEKGYKVLVKPRGPVMKGKEIKNPLEIEILP